MTALQHLRTAGRTTARDIARATGMHIEDVYTELVAEEARGHARVEVTECGRQRICEWVALAAHGPLRQLRALS